MQLLIQSAGPQTETPHASSPRSALSSTTLAALGTYLNAGCAMPAFASSFLSNSKFKALNSKRSGAPSLGR